MADGRDVIFDGQKAWMKRPVIAYGALCLETRDPNFKETD